MGQAANEGGGLYSITENSITYIMSLYLLIPLSRSGWRRKPPGFQVWAAVPFGYHASRRRGLCCPRTMSSSFIVPSHPTS